MLITGANRGIGLEFVRQYAANGWRGVACCRKPAAAEALNRLAAQYPDQVTVHALDVTDHAQIDQLAQTLSEQPIDLFINNAGGYVFAGTINNFCCCICKIFSYRCNLSVFHQYIGVFKFAIFFTGPNRCIFN